MVRTNIVCAVDALAGLRALPDQSVDCVMTSPPFWRLRDYGIDGQIGLEKSVEDYLNHLLEVFDDILRVLKPTGTLWINLGDCYAVKPSNAYHVQKKSLWMVPERFALGMMARGWILRNKIIWHKPNHMPHSVKDRMACSWEYLLYFVKSSHYYFDLDAIRMPHRTQVRQRKSVASQRRRPSVQGYRLPPHPGEPGAYHPQGKNPGDHWLIPQETRTLGALIGQAGVVKVPGGAGWAGHPAGGMARIVRENDRRWLSPQGKNPGDAWSISTRPQKEHPSGAGLLPGGGGHFAVYPEQLCERPILAGCPTGGIVLDPFCGTGTTLVVAKRLGRQYIGFDLNPEYVKMARQRLRTVRSPRKVEKEVSHSQ
ncbi:site-specific DNA-methyltransferase [Planctomycetales bacterium ZRK34]|nr:site-specific DNA-methyltransferase [Planctomycetales bacterium ZRK34]